MGDDGVVLTDREREALAGLAESIGDPWLARQLVGQDQDTPSPPPKRRRPASGWTGLFLVLAGAALAVTTFASSVVLASLGLLLMGAGLGRVVVDKGDVVIRRVTERRPPVPAPSPPRTPPGAA